MFESERERREHVAAFVRAGLAAGERVIYIADAGAVDDAVRERAAAGLDVAAELRRGQFDIRTAASTYLRGGRFDPEAVVRLVAREIERARSIGWPRVRITGEMTWALTGVDGCERLGEYERAVQDVIASTGSIAICQYDVRRFGALAALEAELAHPIVLRGEPARAPAPRCRIDHDGAGALAISGEVDFSNVGRLASALVDAIAADGDVTIEARRLLFVDVAAVRALCSAGAALAERGRSLVVLDARPAVARALELVARAGLPGAEHVARRSSGPPV